MVGDRILKSSVIIDSVLKRFTLSLAEKSQWSTVYSADDSTLRVDLGEPLPSIGDTIRVDLELGPQATKVIFRGDVVSHCNDPKGVRINLGVQERAKVDFLRGYARDGILNLRRLRRLPLSLHVTYGGIQGPIESHTRDLNEEGVFIVGDDPLAEGSELHLLLQFPGEEAPHNLMGHVSHTVVIEDEDIPGMGIVFKMDEATQATLRSSVDKLEQAFIAGKLEARYLG